MFVTTFPTSAALYADTGWAQQERPSDPFGGLTIANTVADSDWLRAILLFTPGRLTEGIELSNDPLLVARGASCVAQIQSPLTPILGLGRTAVRQTTIR